MRTMVETENLIGFSPTPLSYEKSLPFPGEEIPLSALETGDRGVVSRLDGGEDFRCKMLSLGILPGKEVTIARGEKRQPYILGIGDCRVMMDWGALGRIYVKPAPKCGGKGGQRWRWRWGSRI